jgi:hypothetical protein
MFQMESDLLKIADSVADETGGHQGDSMRTALSGGAPRAGGAVEIKRFFGDELEGVLRLCATVVAAIDGMVPGFVDWLNHTGYGDDKLMVLALIDIAEGLATYRRPSGERRRPDSIAPPKHL